MRATVRAPGSCGELVQGTLDGINFLVTCPINCYSEVTVAINNGISPDPARSKTRLAMERTLDRLGRRAVTGAATVRSDIPPGKGMASSSADISAACLATALACGQVLPPETIADLALSIEPTDAVFYPGIMLFDHVRGRIREPLGTPPPATILVLDGGGEVDTVQFNRRRDLAEKNARKEPAIREALALVKAGLAAKDLRQIGEAATISALANQDILPKPDLPRLAKWVIRCGASGINAAHSGTVVGVLCDPGDPELVAYFTREIPRQFPAYRIFRPVQLVGGGLTVAGGEKQVGRTDET